MKTIVQHFLATVLLTLTTVAFAQTDPLPSWNDGAAKQAIVAFVEARDQEGRHGLRAARRAHRHVRQRRHALGRAADVLPVRSSRSTA